MRGLDAFEKLLRGCPIKVYTRYSVLSWLLKSKSADGRCVRWGVILSHWDLEIHKVQSDEDRLAAIMVAGITPREHLDEVAQLLIPVKGQVKPQPVISVEILNADFEGYVLSFDEAAKTSTRQGSLTAQGFILEDVTVNDAEYHGLLKGLAMVVKRDILDVVAVGDSRILIQQYGALREKLKSVWLFHVKREYSQAADDLTSKTLSEQS
ncbi:hypothetical protein PHMEG_00023007 [Phytophthora megakarya]|uniref:RNase H type-1 domain-containing protein n=1 Tax=Phytophthora megakarya TaxID=4795 RepID=A0A225VHV7_9STRA|nr:hypothetical protein PHMEG_00023007 [Phytophthora megakarya]